MEKTPALGRRGWIIAIVTGIGVRVSGIRRIGSRGIGRVKIAIGITPAIVGVARTMASHKEPSDVLLKTGE
jgi:hypothetical protein